MSEREITRRGILVVLSSPSGAGKTTITRELVQRDPLLDVSVSVTTRARRSSESDGKHYHFITRQRFDAMVARGDRLVHASVFGHFYGTPRAPVEAALASGGDGGHRRPVGPRQPPRSFPRPAGRGGRGGAGERARHSQ